MLDGVLGMLTPYSEAAMHCRGMNQCMFEVGRLLFTSFLPLFVQCSKSEFWAILDSVGTLFMLFQPRRLSSGVFCTN